MNTNTPTTVPTVPTVPTAPTAPAPVPETSEPLPQTPPSPPVPPATGEPYPGFHREKAALDARVEAFRRAAANPEQPRIGQSVTQPALQHRARQSQPSPHQPGQ